MVFLPPRADPPLASTLSLGEDSPRIPCSCCLRALTPFFLLSLHKKQVTQLKWQAICCERHPLLHKSYWNLFWPSVFFLVFHVCLAWLFFFVQVGCSPPSPTRELLNPWASFRHIWQRSRFWKDTELLWTQTIWVHKWKTCGQKEERPAQCPLQQLSDVLCQNIALPLFKMKPLVTACTFLDAG